MARTKTNSEFIIEVSQIKDGEDYTFLEDYINAITKIRVRHNKCGMEYLVRPHDFLIGKRCPYCSQHARYTPDTYRYYVYTITQGEYSVIGNFSRNVTPIYFRHNKCNSIFKQAPQNFIRAILHTKYMCPCPNCTSFTKPYTIESYTMELNNRYPGEYSIIDKDSFTNVDSYINVKHHKCGRIFNVKAGHLLYDGTYCKYCTASRGERLVQSYLDNNEIKYEKQKRFPDCKDKYTLPFDFYLPESNILIEYDGSQHNAPSTYFGQESYDLTHKHDIIKDDYADSMGYKLIRIPYTENNIKKVYSFLNSHLN
ncbi:hypothetical protein [Lactobacillus phage Semele]|uniref:Homing endonuclease n=1 Tax=Lactobacillus phage Semele TaxID=2079433 RepID=A0A2K9VDC8_9CAUD|nr:HNH endonuclease [Lactobacillus phage Semele]AUV60227.1 hypothetical protein [Lactobacillus phage Semele]